MEILLMVLGGITLVGLLVLLVGFFWLRSKWRGLKEGLMGLAKAFGGGVPPFRINVTPAEEPIWERAEAAAAATKAMESLGYSTIGDFEIDEMGDVLLRAFVNPEQCSYCAMYEHDAAGMFADFVVTYEDATALTVSTSPDQGMDRPEFATMVRLQLSLEDEPEASVKQMHERLVQERGGRPAIPAAADLFKTVFEDSYHKEMDWRIERGGPTAQEVRNAAAAGGQEEPDDEAIKMVQSTWQQAIGDFFDEQLREGFVEQSDMSAAEWEKARHRLQFVHDRTHQESLIGNLAWQMMDDDDDERDPHEDACDRLRPVFEQAGDVRAGYRAAQELLPENRRSTFHKSVTEPLAADVWIGPDDDDCYDC
jgi:hypothetical protein